MRLILQLRHTDGYNYDYTDHYPVIGVDVIDLKIEIMAKVELHLRKITELKKEIDPLVRKLFSSGCTVEMADKLSQLQKQEKELQLIHIGKQSFDLDYFVSTIRNKVEVLEPVIFTLDEFFQFVE